MALMKQHWPPAVVAAAAAAVSAGDASGVGAGKGGAGKGGGAAARLALLTYATGVPPHWLLGRSAALHGVPLVLAGLGRRVHTWCTPGAHLVHTWCIPGAHLVHTWCIPGACHVHVMCIPSACHMHATVAPLTVAPLTRRWAGVGVKAPAARRAVQVLL